MSVIYWGGYHHDPVPESVLPALKRLEEIGVRHTSFRVWVARFSDLSFYVSLRRPNAIAGRKVETITQGVTGCSVALRQKNTGIVLLHEVAHCLVPELASTPPGTFGRAQPGDASAISGGRWREAFADAMAIASYASTLPKDGPRRSGVLQAIEELQKYRNYDTDSPAKHNTWPIITRLKFGQIADHPDPASLMQRVIERLPP